MIWAVSRGVSECSSMARENRLRSFGGVKLSTVGRQGQEGVPKSET